jgi:hypothetical protein
VGSHELGASAVPSGMEQKFGKGWNIGEEDTMSHPEIFKILECKIKINLMLDCLKLIENSQRFKTF